MPSAHVAVKAASRCLPESASLTAASLRARWLLGPKADVCLLHVYHRVMADRPRPDRLARESGLGRGHELRLGLLRLSCRWLRVAHLKTLVRIPNRNRTRCTARERTAAARGLNGSLRVDYEMRRNVWHAGRPFQCPAMLFPSVDRTPVNRPRT